MRRILIAALLVLTFSAIATATPQQAAQIKRQQAAIKARNKTISKLRADIVRQTEPCRSLDYTRPFAGVDDTCEMRVSGLTAARDTAQGALSGSVTNQLNVMTPAQIWDLMSTIYARLGPPFSRSVFSGSGFVSYTFSS